MRKTVFANEQYYHIYNRGVDKREVFLDEEDYLRFLTCLREFNNELIREAREARRKFSELSSGAPELSSENFSLEEVQPLVEIIVYCLNPNHYHLMLKQLVENGIKIFMHKLGTGYTNYFNKKYNRSGSLFQGPFKAIHIDSNEYLPHLSVYINKNYFIHGYDKSKFLEAKPPLGGLASKNSPSEWKYCSVLDYLGKRNGTLCKKEVILDQFAVTTSELSSERFEFNWLIVK
jgi:putative transposase